jgi:tetratricopeptide (TPR) repeat protein
MLKNCKLKHANYASALCELASIYKKQGWDGEAEPLYTKAEEILLQLKKDTPTSLDDVPSLNNLAKLYFERHQYDKAEPLYKEVVDIYNLYKKELGPTRFDYISSLNNLA